MKYDLTDYSDREGINDIKDGGCAGDDDDDW